MPVLCLRLLQQEARRPRAHDAHEDLGMFTLHSTLVPFLLRSLLVLHTLHLRQVVV